MRRENTEKIENKIKGERTYWYINGQADIERETGVKRVEGNRLTNRHTNK